MTPSPSSYYPRSSIDYSNIDQKCPSCHHPKCSHSKITSIKPIFFTPTSEKSPSPTFPSTSPSTKPSKSTSSTSPTSPISPNGTRPIGTYIIAGVASGIFIASILWVADRFGTLWGGILASIPVSLVVISIFYKEDKLKNFTFALVLGGIASLVATVTFFLLIKNTKGNKFVLLTLALLAWLITVGILFWSFRKEFEGEK